MFNVEEATELSFRNRSQITPETICGCYYCLDVFEGKDIEEWADGGETAICPTCGVDSILPNESDMDSLAAACERWFTGEGDEFDGEDS